MSERLAEATAYAEALHRGQTRKGTSIPYISHPCAVAKTLKAWGADEDTVIAGLLHDTVEDCGGMPIAQAIRERFGDRVAQIVLECSDSLEADAGNKTSWRERKQGHIDHLKTASDETILVTLADKTHNMACLVEDLNRYGAVTLSRFKEPTLLLWYYGQILSACRRPNIPQAAIEQADAQFVAFGTSGYVAYRLSEENDKPDEALHI